MPSPLVWVHLAIRADAENFSVFNGQCLNDGELFVEGDDLTVDQYRSAASFACACK